MGTIIQRFFCAQSGAGIRLNFWKWFVKSRYPGALSPVLENFRRAFSPGPTDRPWVSEDAITQANLFYHQTEVAKVLNDIDLAKAPGPDNIGGRLPKETAPEISVSLCRLFNLSLSRGEFPDQGKLTNVCPVFKKDDPALAKKYCQISSLSISSKCFERCVFNHCYPHILPRLCHLQHGFLRGRSTVTQLAQVNHEVINAFAEGKEIDVVYLDFAKAFDKVPYSTVINKLSLLYIRPVETMVPELSLQQISASSATGYLFQLASTYF